MNPSNLLFAGIIRGTHFIHGMLCLINKNEKGKKKKEIEIEEKKRKKSKSDGVADMNCAVDCTRKKQWCENTSSSHFITGSTALSHYIRILDLKSIIETLMITFMK
jgi:hypothetical protein